MNHLELMSVEALPSPVRDPYDIWSSPALGKLKKGWVKGEPTAKFLLPLVGAAEIAAPVALRRAMRVPLHCFPHMACMQALASTSRKLDWDRLVNWLASIRSGSGWGLPFAWYSKNADYPAGTPYITNTPYVMEFLVAAAKSNLPNSPLAAELFDDTWCFLESLQVMARSMAEIAISYAPFPEERLVVNANSYGALAYALHAVHGRDDLRCAAREKAILIANWVLNQQRDDGSWLYYAGEDDARNFIDCFHSCLVLKNLLKVRDLLDWNCDSLVIGLKRGFLFIDRCFFDASAGLCRPFAKTRNMQVFKWDIYDQAEFLGLLVSLGQTDRARALSNRVEQVFTKRGEWYCRVDRLGRRWGRGFLRWGIVPYLYHRARLLGAT